MLSKILIGVDGGPAGRDAAVLASALGAGADVDLLLVGVYPDPLLPFPLVLRRDAHVEQETAQMLLEVRRECVPEGRTRTVADISPARALRHLAEREHAELLVLGSSRRAQEGHACGGRMARQALHHAPCPVAIAASGLARAPFRLRRIVVGIDGSPEAAAALTLAVALAHGAPARLEVVAVADDTLPPMVAPVGAPGVLVRWDELVAQHRDYAERLVRAATDSAAGDAAAGSVRVGDPAVELAAAADGADLLVLGSRHWGAFERIAIGSTGEELLRTATCSLLFVPRPVQAAAAQHDDAAVGAADGGAAA